MSMLDAIQAARAHLETITPLKSDCGRRCAAACCQADEGGKGGMLLFPDEEALYDAAPSWAELSDSGLMVFGKSIKFLICDGTCPREDRPLSCRIFPLTPINKEGELAIELDVRAWPVCPLMGYGMEGLSREFVAGVHAAMALLWAQAEGRAYIDVVTRQLSLFKSL